MVKFQPRPSRIWPIWWLLSAAGIVAWGAIVRFTLPQWPLFFPDSCYYVYPSINGGIYNIGPRIFVYPGFCRAVLLLAHDWRSPVVVQHLLGLLGPAWLSVCWVYLGSRIWVARPAFLAHAAAGLGLLILLIPSASFINYEQSILLEGFSFFLQCGLGGLLCLLWLPHPPLPRQVLACATAALGVFMYYANTRWGAAMPATIALAAWATLLRPGAVFQRLRYLLSTLATAAVVFLVLGFTQSRIAIKGPWDDSFSARVLLWMHADLVANEFRRDLAAAVPPPQAAALRDAVAKIDQAVVGYGSGGWETITFNANTMFYAPGCPDSIFLTAFRKDPAAYKRFCFRYFGRIVWHQPKAYFSEVWRMLSWYYVGPRGDGAFQESTQPMSEAMVQSALIARSYIPIALPAQRATLEAAAKGMELSVAKPINYAEPAWLRGGVFLLHFCLLPVTILGVTCAGTVLALRKVPADDPLTVLAWVCLGSTGLLFAQVLTLALVTVTQGRYADALRPLAVFSLECAGAMIIGTIAKFRYRRCHRAPSPSQPTPFP